MPFPLACVLECSTIGSMMLLSIIVVITRIGVNKTPPAKPYEPPPGPSDVPAPPAADGAGAPPASDTMPT